MCIQSGIKYQGLLSSHCQNPLSSAWVRNYNKLSLYVHYYVFCEMRIRDFGSHPHNIDIKQTKPKFLSLLRLNVNLVKTAFDINKHLSLLCM